MSYIEGDLLYVNTEHLLDSGNGHRVFQSGQRSLFGQFVVDLPGAEDDSFDSLSLSGSGVTDESLETCPLVKVREFGFGLWMSEKTLGGHDYELEGGEER